MKGTMNTVYLGLGSNLGDRLSSLQKSVTALEESPGMEIQKISPVYETEPVGVSSPQPPYYNAAVELKTKLSPMDLLRLTKDIEFTLGRRNKEMKDSRYLDLDILVYNQAIIRTPLLQVPHPLLEHRWFVLVPLNDIASDFIPPGFNFTIGDCLNRLGTPQGVYPLKEEMWPGSLSRYYYPGYL